MGKKHIAIAIDTVGKLIVIYSIDIYSSLIVDFYLCVGLTSAPSKYIKIVNKF